jgi:hypothetical protein
MGLRWPNRQSKRLLPLRMFFDSHRGLVQNVWDFVQDVKRGGSEDWEPGYEVDFNPKADGGESEICLNALRVHWIGA